MSAAIEYINTIGDSFVRFAWPMLIQSSVLILILLLADLLLRKRVRAVFRYWLWMLVLIKLLLPVSLSTPASLGTIAGQKLSLSVVSPRTFNPQRQLSPAAIPPPTETQPETFVAEDSFDTLTTKPLPAAAIATPILTWQAVVFLIWLAVVAATLLLLIQRLMFVYGLIRQSQKANALLTDTLEFCRKQIGLRQKVSLKVSPNATSPAVCGLFRPVILVPNNLAPSLGSSHLRAVLMHELAHIKRGDLWVNMAQTLLQIVYFYNPFFWLANAVIRRIREQAVDETVQVALGERAPQYPETLLNVAKLAFQRPALSLRLVGVVESKTALKERIKKMLEMPVPKTAKLGIVGLLAIFVIGVVLLPMAGAQKTKGGQYKTRTSSSNTPTVVKTIPEAFKNDVSPNLRKIKVMFDQPMMDKSWSWVRWNYPYPETTGEPYYNSTKNTCTLPVILESGKAYFVRINSEPYMNFKSEKGISAQPYVLVFATKDENGNPTVIPQEMLDKAKQINTVNPIPYTQELVAQIRPDGTIDFVNTVRSINEGDSAITTTNFINSDFVNVTSMSDGKGRPIKFTTTHDGNHYSYHLVFNEAIKPKELMVYSHKGTMSGLVKPVEGLENTYRYYMKHWPSSGRPTRRIETFILPKGAKLISTTPSDMGKSVQNSRIELHVDEIIPEGKSITTEFEYSLATDEYHEEIELAYDDGKSAGKWSFSGGGHGVKFTAPSEDCVLKAIKLYGSRYGGYEPPDENFDVWVCDKNFNVIKNFRFPYSLFKKRGYTKWVTLKVDDVQVPEEFAICAAFDPHQTKGIYVYHDAKTSRRSYQGMPPQMEPFKDGDWMIRAVIEQPAGINKEGL